MNKKWIFNNLKFLFFYKYYRFFSKSRVKIGRPFKFEKSALIFSAPSSPNWFHLYIIENMIGWCAFKGDIIPIIIPDRSEFIEFIKKFYVKNIR